MGLAVLYFGGFQASDQDIDAWLRSARVQKPAIDFTGFPWPKGAGPSAKNAVDAFSRHGGLDAVIDDIQGNGADKTYLVGHSSGCAIANAVDAGLEWTEDTILVTLDGFSPNDDQLDRETTQVWGAMCQGKPSLNFPGPSKGRRRIFHVTHCTTQWALHFSLVNANAKDGLVKDVASGYADCRANLLFL